ncbi:MAG: hypothetical protein HC853_10125 [Anaerolineae bacterium]|nr:hypothetical protein [Anaerolineae bacterium]
MKILFDQGAPVPLRAHLFAHEVDTAYERGWSELQNGDLLQAAEADSYDVFVTTDQNLKYQQNLMGRKLAILVLLTTSWPIIKPHSAEICQIIEGLVIGEYQEFGIIA